MERCAAFLGTEGRIFRHVLPYSTELEAVYRSTILPPLNRSTATYFYEIHMGPQQSTSPFWRFPQKSYLTLTGRNLILRVETSVTEKWSNWQKLFSTTINMSSKGFGQAGVVEK